jgi:hypothetical protein
MAAPDLSVSVEFFEETALDAVSGVGGKGED